MAVLGDTEGNDEGDSAAVPAAPEASPTLDAQPDKPIESFEQEVQDWDRAVKALQNAQYEAELHMLHGATDAAIEVLSHHVSSPEAGLAGVRPWTMLFDIYRSQGDEASFRALVGRFRTQFNVAPPSWNPDSNREAEAGLEEAFPQVVERITSMWPSSDCLRYLEGLLLNDREGEREGFSLQVAEEMELLRDVMRARLGESHERQTRADGPEPADAPVTASPAGLAPRRSSQQ